MFLNIIENVSWPWKRINIYKQPQVEYIEKFMR